MDKNISNLQPTAIWANFYQLTQIPRPSKNEAKVISFIEKFGQNLGLETIVDEIGNVIIRKPATSGMENRRGVILQSHLDMVPQKNSDKVHDFKLDPIEAYIDGEWVTANDTTLGADNGIGASAAMAVLASDNIEHGPIEALFTIDEETGMTGAFGLKPGLLKGEILMNLDSEDEGELYIGCAGGIDTTAKFNFKMVKAPVSARAFKISVKGLKGGHSGLDIHLKRGNANKIINRILSNGNEHLNIYLAALEGGNLRNAIPREAFATVAVPTGEVENFKKLVKDNEDYYKKNLTDDQGLVISLTEVEMPDEFIDNESLDNILNAIHLCPNGVIKMSKEIAGVVETSSNLAIVKMDGTQLTVAFLHRSSSENAKKELCKQVREIFEKYGASAEHSGDYPGWQPNPDSAILNIMKNVYHTNFGKIPEVKVIHAGLECGILGASYPNWDMISFGPTIRFPHSPDEKVHIESVGKFWDYLIKTLKEIPSK